MKILFFPLIFLCCSLRCLACETTLTLGLGLETWPPYYMEEKGKSTGADIEFIRQVLNEADICLGIVKMPSSERAQLEIQNGNIDFLYSASYSEKRAEYAAFSLPYRDERVRIFWKKSQHQHLTNKTLVDLVNSGLMGVSNRGGYIGNYNQKVINDHSKITRVSTLRQRIRLLGLDRVDFAIEDELSGLYYLHQHDIKNIELHPYVVYKNEVALMFSRKSVPSKIIDKINLAIQKKKHHYPTILAQFML